MRDFCERLGALAFLGGRSKSGLGVAGTGRSRTAASQSIGTRKLRAPRTIVAMCSWSGRLLQPASRMKTGIGVSSAIRLSLVVKIGLRIVRASWSG